MRTEVSATRETGSERQFSVQLGGLLGLDLRPSRLFFWFGRDREASQRIVSLDRAPRVLRRPRPRRFVHAGPVEISYLGNPVATMVVSARAWYRQVRRAKHGDAMR